MPSTLTCWKQLYWFLMILICLSYFFPLDFLHSFLVLICFLSHSSTDYQRCLRWDSSLLLHQETHRKQANLLEKGNNIFFLFTNLSQVLFCFVYSQKTILLATDHVLSLLFLHKILRIWYLTTLP